MENQTVNIPSRNPEDTTATFKRRGGLRRSSLGGFAAPKPPRVSFAQTVNIREFMKSIPLAAMPRTPLKHTEDSVEEDDHEPSFEDYEEVIEDQPSWSESSASVSSDSPSPAPEAQAIQQPEAPQEPVSMDLTDTINPTSPPKRPPEKDSVPHEPKAKKPRRVSEAVMVTPSLGDVMKFYPDDESYEARPSDAAEVTGCLQDIIDEFAEPDDAPQEMPARHREPAAEAEPAHGRRGALEYSALEQPATPESKELSQEPVGAESTLDLLREVISKAEETSDEHSRLAMSADEHTRLGASAGPLEPRLSIIPKQASSCQDSMILASSITGSVLARAMAPSSGDDDCMDLTGDFTGHAAAAAVAGRASQMGDFTKALGDNMDLTAAYQLTPRQSSSMDLSNVIAAVEAAAEAASVCRERDVSLKLSDLDLTVGHTAEAPAQEARPAEDAHIVAYCHEHREEPEAMRRVSVDMELTKVVPGALAEEVSPASHGAPACADSVDEPQEPETTRRLSVDMEFTKVVPGALVEEASSAEQDAPACAADQEAEDTRRVSVDMDLTKVVRGALAQEAPACAPAQESLEDSTRRMSADMEFTKVVRAASADDEESPAHDAAVGSAASQELQEATGRVSVDMDLTKVVVVAERPPAPVSPQSVDMSEDPAGAPAVEAARIEELPQEACSAACDAISTASQEYEVPEATRRVSVDMEFTRIVPAGAAAAQPSSPDCREPRDAETTRNMSVDMEITRVLPNTHAAAEAACPRRESVDMELTKVVPSAMLQQGCQSVDMSDSQENAPQSPTRRMSVAMEFTKVIGAAQALSPAVAHRKEEDHHSEPLEPTSVEEMRASSPARMASTDMQAATVVEAAQDVAPAAQPVQAPIEPAVAEQHEAAAACATQAPSDVSPIALADVAQEQHAAAVASPARSAHATETMGIAGVAQGQQAMSSPVHPTEAPAPTTPSALAAAPASPAPHALASEMPAARMPSDMELTAVLPCVQGQQPPVSPAPRVIPAEAPTARMPSDMELTAVIGVAQEQQPSASPSVAVAASGEPEQQQAAVPQVGGAAGAVDSPVLRRLSDIVQVTQILDTSRQEIAARRSSVCVPADANAPESAREDPVPQAASQQQPTSASPAKPMAAAAGASPSEFSQRLSEVMELTESIARLAKSPATPAKPEASAVPASVVESSAKPPAPALATPTRSGAAAAASTPQTVLATPFTAVSGLRASALGSVTRKFSYGQREEETTEERREAARQSVTAALDSLAPQSPQFHIISGKVLEAMDGDMTVESPSRHSSKEAAYLAAEAERRSLEEAQQHGADDSAEMSVEPEDDRPQETRSAMAFERLSALTPLRPSLRPRIATPAHAPAVYQHARDEEEQDDELGDDDDDEEFTSASEYESDGQESAEMAGQDADEVYSTPPETFSNDDQSSEHEAAQPQQTPVFLPPPIEPEARKSPVAAPAPAPAPAPVATEPEGPVGQPVCRPEASAEAPEPEQEQLPQAAQEPAEMQVDVPAAAVPSEPAQDRAGNVCAPAAAEASVLDMDVSASACVAPAETQAPLQEEAAVPVVAEVEVHVEPEPEPPKPAPLTLSEFLNLCGATLESSVVPQVPQEAPEGRGACCSDLERRIREAARASEAAVRLQLVESLRAEVARLEDHVRARTHEVDAGAMLHVSEQHLLRVREDVASECARLTSEALSDYRSRFEAPLHKRIAEQRAARLASMRDVAARMGEALRRAREHRDACEADADRVAAQALERRQLAQVSLLTRVEKHTQTQTPADKSAEQRSADERAARTARAAAVLHELRALKLKGSSAGEAVFECGPAHVLRVAVDEGSGAPVSAKFERACEPAGPSDAFVAALYESANVAPLLSSGGPVRSALREAMRRIELAAAVAREVTRLSYRYASRRTLGERGEPVLEVTFSSRESQSRVRALFELNAESPRAAGAFVAESLRVCRSFGKWQFANKVVLVTGGSSGIGRAAVLSFARAGAKVVFCSRDSNPEWFTGRAVESEVNSDPQVRSANGTARWVRADVSELDQAQALIKTVVDTHGHLDIAVNNAGISGPLGSVTLLRQYLRTQHDPIRNNVYGVLNSVVAETEYWVRANRSGVIVNTASVDGLTGTPGGAMYGASKHAIVGITKSVALEFAKGFPKIRVNAVAPGLTDTPLTRNQLKTPNAGGVVEPWTGAVIDETSPLWQKMSGTVSNTLPNGRIATAEEQANVILFLSSDHASYMSAATFTVDFGITAGTAPASSTTDQPTGTAAAPAVSIVAAVLSATLAAII
eukprot:m51a1_g5689 hypothetical protein (2280) ;mRNA; f:991224-999087